MICLISLTTGLNSTKLHSTSPFKDVWGGGGGGVEIGISQKSLYINILLRVLRQFKNFFSSVQDSADRFS